MIFLLIVAAVAVYFVPTFVAAIRVVPNFGPLFVVNLFLGWTVVGWVVSLAMAVRDIPEYSDDA